MAVEISTETPLFKIGNMGKIKCALKTSDNRIFQVDWYKNDVSLSANDKHSMDKNVLTIHDIDAHDSGKYTCKINVDNLSTSKSIHVNVIGNYKI